MTTASAEVVTAITAAQQYAALAAGVAGPFLTPKQQAAVTLATTALGLVLRSMEQQSDIDAVSFAQLDAQEALILAEDRRAQVDAEIRKNGG